MQAEQCVKGCETTCLYSKNGSEDCLSYAACICTLQQCSHIVIYLQLHYFVRLEGCQADTKMGQNFG